MHTEELSQESSLMPEYHLDFVAARHAWSLIKGKPCHKSFYLQLHWLAVLGLPGDHFIGKSIFALECKTCKNDIKCFGCLF